MTILEEQPKTTEQQCMFTVTELGMVDGSEAIEVVSTNEKGEIVSSFVMHVKPEGKEAVVQTILESLSRSLAARES